MRDAWAEAFGERARAYWTSERTEELVRGKKLAILPGEAPELLRALGILHRDATMPPSERRKFFQINHVVAALGPSLRELVVDEGPRSRGTATRPLRIVDAACGRSYLTLLLAHALTHHYGVVVEVLGVDRNAALMEESARRTRAAGLEALVRHHASTLEELDVEHAWATAFPGAVPLEGVDAVVALHACDTATDDALLLGARLDATLLAVTPCCQAELARGWSQLAAEGGEGVFAPIQRTPHLRRELGALLTDTMRTLLLRERGYETWALELVPTEHTPKNTLLRAMNRHRPDAAAGQEHDALVATTGGVAIGLAARLRGLV